MSDSFARLVRLVRVLRGGLACSDSEEGDCNGSFNKCHDATIRAELKRAEKFIERVNREKANSPS